MQASWRDRLLRPVRVRLMNMVADAVTPLLSQREQQLAELRAENRRVYDRLIEFEIRTRRDIVYAADRQATLESAEFVRAHMPTAPRFDDPHRTLEHALSRHPGPVDFVHVDADLYSSAKTVLDLVGPRLRPGSVLVFDEFFNFPGWQEHECRALQEYVERTGVSISYEGYCYANEQVIVRITK
jgi:hypothetical protein